MIKSETSCAKIFGPVATYCTRHMQYCQHITCIDATNNHSCSSETDKVHSYIVLLCHACNSLFTVNMVLSAWYIAFTMYETSRTYLLVAGQR